MDFRENKWECDGIETQELRPVNSREVKTFNEISMMHIVKFKNLRLNPNNGKEQIVIKGNSFLATLHYYYYHSFLEMMGTYALIKGHIPDLKCYFNSMFGKDPVWRKEFNDRSLDSYLEYLKYSPFGAPDVQSEINHHEFTKGLVDMFSEDKNIYTIESDNIVFENFYMLLEMPTGFSGNSWERFRNLIFLSKIISKFLTPTDSKNKIYISRKTNNKRYKDFVDFQPKTVTDLKSRAFDEDEIEKYFNSIGYKTVILEGMPLIEQLNLFYNATHIAGLNGSGFVNLIAAKNNTRVIELNLIKDYKNRTNYEYMFKFKSFDFSSYSNLSENIPQIIEELKLLKNQ